METFEYLAEVEAHIPPGCFVRLIEELEAAYPASVLSCESQFDEPEAHDLIPYYRRALVESAVSRVAREFSHRGIEAVPARNATESAFHREMHAGPIVLTASFVEGPETLVDRAEFRSTLATSPQLRLDGLSEGAALAKSFFGLILHGAKRVGVKKFSRNLGFVRLAIPNRDCTRYLASYDLITRYADIDVEDADKEAALAAGVPIELIRRPSALLLERRRPASGRRA